MLVTALTVGAGFSQKGLLACLKLPVLWACCTITTNPIPVGTIPCLSQITVCLISCFHCDTIIVVIKRMQD